MALICTVCGAENMEGSMYCEDCGARLPVSGGPAVAPPITPPIAPPVPVAPAPTFEAAEPTREAMPAVPVPMPAAASAAASTPGGDQICGTCGATNGPGEMYCEDCGAALGAGAPSPSPSVNFGQVPPPAVVPQAIAPTAITPAPGAPSTPGKPRLEAVSSGQSFVLAKDENAVGRRSPVDGIFPEVDLTEADIDSYISRRHGKVLMGEQGAIYEDLGSSNGSFHNGTRLQQGVQALLKDGDRLRLGKTELVFHAH